MLDVRRNKNAVRFLAEVKKDKACQLLLTQWKNFSEMILILSIPFKAIIHLQKRDLILPDAYGIWLKTMIHLRTPDIRKLRRTNLA